MEQNISYKPIYIIFGYLILISVLTNVQHFDIYSMMSVFMAGFFLIFSFFKMLDFTGFAVGYAKYDLVAQRIYYYGYVYPFIELAFGVAYLISPFNFWLNLSVFIIMSVSTIGVVKSKLEKNQIQCACVGTFLKVPLGNITIIEDILMVIMSLFMLFSMGSESVNF